MRIGIVTIRQHRRQDHRSSNMSVRSFVRSRRSVFTACGLLMPLPAANQHSIP